jgi:hypothetical protein
MPAKSAYEGSAMNPNGKANKGPAIKMDPIDHQSTASHWSQGREGRIYREKQKEFIQQGKLKEAIQMDIDNVREIAADLGKPDKYECAIKEMVDYYNTLDPNDFIIK